MKKLVWIVSLVAILWVIKLSYGVYELNTSQQLIGDQIRELQQQNANLNDQVIAFKRQAAVPTSESENKNSALNDHNKAVSDDSALVRQHLDFIEFALQQRQYATALEKLSQLEQSLKNYQLSAALRDSLQATLVKDREMLKQFIASELNQDNQLKEIMRKIDDEISSEMRQPYQAATHEASSFWQRLIQIESVKQPSPVLLQRAVILKEAQLRLLMAQNALQSGQQLVFVKAIDAVEDVLKQLPDQKSKKWIEQLNQMKTVPLTPLPMLNTRTLIGE